MIKYIVSALLSSCIASDVHPVTQWANTPPLATVTDKVFMDIDIDGEPIGRIVFGLFGDVVPETVANFKGLS